MCNVLRVDKQLRWPMRFFGNVTKLAVVRFMKYCLRKSSYAYCLPFVASYSTHKGWMCPCTIKVVVVVVFSAAQSTNICLFCWIFFLFEIWISNHSSYSPTLSGSKSLYVVPHSQHQYYRKTLMYAAQNVNCVPVYLECVLRRVFDNVTKDNGRLLRCYSAC